MNAATLIVLALLAVWLIRAVRSVKKSGCGGDCSRCGKHCGYRKKDE